MESNVVPNIAHRFPDDTKFVRTMGLALLCVVCEVDHFGLPVPAVIVSSVRNAYNNLELENKPTQPVNRVPLRAYQVDETVVIEDALAISIRRDDQEDVEAANANGLPIVAQGGVEAMLQQILVNQRLLAQQQIDMDARHQARHNELKEYCSKSFEQINRNIMRYGGTIHGAMARQEPSRRQMAARDGFGNVRSGGTTTTTRRPTASMPELTKNISSLMELWMEWEFGIDGRKPAKLWTPSERGNKQFKMIYQRRKQIW